MVRSIVIIKADLIKFNYL